MVELVGVEPTSERVHFGFHARRNRNNPIGRGGRIWTRDILVPNQTLYQTELRPDKFR